MTTFLLFAAGGVLATLALGLLRVVRGPADADRMLAVQLVGSGGTAIALLLGAATGVAGATDLALVLALLAAFTALAFVRAGERAAPDARPENR
jgi:multicomponent Na+:H+ antiporter subunit F